MLLARVGWLVLGALWVFVLVGLVSFDAGDAPSHAVWPSNAKTANWTGPIGAYMSYGLLRVFGFGILIPMVFTGLMLTLRLLRRPMTQPIVRAMGVVVLTSSLCVLLGLLMTEAGPMPGLSGGTIGLVGAGMLLPAFAMTGSLVWVVLATVVGLIVSCDKYLWQVPMAIWGVVAERVLPVVGSTGAKAGAIAGSTAVRANASADRASETGRLVGRKASGGVLAGRPACWSSVGAMP